MSARPFNIRICFPEGEPGGGRIVEQSGWNGYGLICSRQGVSAVRHRPKFARAGVYLLIGAQNENELPEVYTGEADPLVNRPLQEACSERPRERLYGFLATGQKLNKAHLQYIGHRLVQTAKPLNRCHLRNANVPAAPRQNPQRGSGPVSPPRTSVHTGVDRPSSQA